MKNGILQILWALQVHGVKFRWLLWDILIIYLLFIVLGNQSLDELESYVREHFNNVENKNVTPNIWSDHPYESGNPTITHVVPIKDIRTLNMSFPIPDTQEHFRNKPVSYISHLVS